jgi:hypothetical protein
MLGQLKRRSFNSVGDQSHAFSWLGWLKRAWQFGVARHTSVVVAIALLWLPLASARRFSHACDRLTGLLLAWAMLHIAIGRQGVYQHEWWWWPLTPGLVIAAALVIDALATRLHERYPQRAVDVGLSVCVLCFAAWNFWAIRDELAAVNRPGASVINYSLIELGQVIRESAPPNAAVMIAESDQSLATWYYADRAMKRSIWDLNNFRRRLTDGMVEASFDHPQPWSGPVAAMIVPKAYLPMLVPGLIEYLDANYPRRDAGKFIVYDLSAATIASMRDAKQTLEQTFLEMRWRCLSLAADLDRVQRAPGGNELVRADKRLQTLRQAIFVLSEFVPGRAERVQMLFSDRSAGTEARRHEGTKGAS